MNGITLLIIIVPILVAVLLFVNVLLAPNNPDYEKVSSYECGFLPLEGQTRAPFSISYYLVGILFLLFDLEILLLYPLAVSLEDVSSMGYWVAMIFLGVLTIGFVVEISSRVLYFTDQKSSL